jgi:hypothetical protein
MTDDGHSAAGHARLITNVRYATIGVIQPVRTHVSGILLEDREPLRRGTARPQVVSGFGPRSEWSVFDLRLGCGVLEYEIILGASRDLTVGTDGELRPLAQGAIVKWKDGTTIALRFEDDARLIDILDIPVGELRDVLALKAADYWRGPNIPSLRWLDAAAVRRQLG